MAYIYPFQNFAEEIKTRVPGVFASNSLSNIEPSLKFGKRDVVALVGKDVWKLAIDHYNSENYDVADEDDASYILLNELVHLVQDACALFTFYHHFIFFVVRISDGGVTIVKGEGETTAYRYQIDEAKEKLIEMAWNNAGALIEFLNENATPWEAWTAREDYSAGTTVKVETTYYECITSHTASEDFNDDLAYWLERDDMVLTEWTNSDQFPDVGKMLFKDARDFNQFYNIDNSWYFYVNCKALILGVIEDDARPMVSDLYSRNDATLLRKLKRAIAYRVMALAMKQFDFYMLPAPTRKQIDNEQTIMKSSKKDDSDFVKDRLSNSINTLADRYFEDVQDYLDTLARKADLITETKINDYSEADIHRQMHDKFYGL